MLALLLCVVAALPTFGYESVDLIELNHFHEEEGRHVYDQLIFYEWSPSQAKYHVRAWCLVEPKEFSKLPTEINGRTVVRWYDKDQQIDRRVSSPLYRETWTQVDPERANKKILPENQRTQLINGRTNDNRQ